jgi:hypothetical protein
MYGGAQVIVPASLGDTSMSASSRMNMGQGSDYLRLHQGQYGGAAVSLAAAAPMGYTGMLDDSLRSTARVGVLDQSMDAIQGMQDGGGRRKKGRMNHKLIAAMLKKLNKKGSKTRRQRGGMPIALTMALLKKARKFIRGGGGMSRGMGRAMRQRGGMFRGLSRAIRQRGGMFRGLRRAIRQRGGMFRGLSRAMRRGGGISRGMGRAMRQRGGMPYALTQAQDYSTPGMLLSPSAERAAVGHMNPEWKLAADPGAFSPRM